VNVSHHDVLGQTIGRLLRRRFDSRRSFGTPAALKSVIEARYKSTFVADPPSRDAFAISWRALCQSKRAALPSARQM